MVIKSRVAGGLFAAMVLALFGIANLPFQYVETEAEWLGHLDLPESGLGVLPKLPVMAGWPLRYWIRYEEGDQIQHRFWAPSRLAVNLVIGWGLSLLVYGFMQLRRRKLIEFPDSHGLRLLFDCLVAVAIVAVPAVIFGWQSYIALQHRQLASKFSRKGNSYVSSWIPAVLDEHLPKGIKRGFAKIRKVQFFAATPKMTGQIASLSSLVSIHSYSGQHDAQTLRKLVGHPHFCSLLLSGCEIRDEEIDVISQLRWLQQLRLSGTNLNIAQLRKLDHLALRMVDLSSTAVTLSEIGRPGWSQTCERFWILRI